MSGSVSTGLTSNAWEIRPIFDRFIKIGSLESFVSESNFTRCDVFFFIFVNSYYVCKGKNCIKQPAMLFLCMCQSVSVCFCVFLFHYAVQQLFV